MATGLWRLVVSPPAPAVWNMAVDEAIMQSVRQKIAPPTVRFYRWATPSISLGFFQQPGEVLDLEACTRSGISVVRRPTGGRAVWHGREITYSLVAGEDHPLFSASVWQTYRIIAAALQQGLLRLGAEVELDRGRDPRAGGEVCFASATRYELTWRGKKLVGSAQCRKRGVILQHGSILLENDHRQLVRLLRTETEEQRQEVNRYLEEGVCGLREILGFLPAAEQIIANLAAGLAESLQVNFYAAGLSEAELELAGILQEKYRLNC